MITFVTGGARSGKSSFAENIFRDKKDVVYIATSINIDEEMNRRIELHKESRPKYWRTFEGYRDIYKSIGTEKNYILDCLTIMTSNIMFDITKDMKKIDKITEKEIEDIVFLEIEKFIDEIKRNKYNLVIVTNEVGLSIVPDNHISRVFRDIQGRVNQRIAKISKEAYLVVAGIPVKLK